jgi:hypothetical protein
MVIQPNMSPKAIAEVWDETREIFEEYNVPMTEQKLEQTVPDYQLQILLSALNSTVGSSTNTCIEGG